MANELKNFLDKNSPDIIIGLIVGAGIAICGAEDLFQGLTMIVLAPMLAIILSNLLRVFVPNENNQRVAIIILSVIGIFIFMQQFQLGIYSLQSISNPIPIQGQFLLTGQLLTAALGATSGGIFITIGIIALVAFFINPIFGMVVLGVILLFVGIPVIGLSIAIISNFKLILIILGMVAIGNLVLSTKTGQKALSRKR